MSSLPNSLLLSILLTFNPLGADWNDINEIPMDTLNSHSFKVIKEFLYGIPILVTSENVLSILILANRNLLSLLEQQCCYFIVKEGKFDRIDPFKILEVAQK